MYYYLLQLLTNFLPFQFIVIITVILFAITASLFIFNIDPFPNNSLILSSSFFMLIGMADAYFSKRIDKRYLLIELAISISILIYLLIVSKKHIKNAILITVCFVISGYFWYLLAKLIVWISPKFVIILALLLLLFIFCSIKGLNRK